MKFVFSKSNRSSELQRIGYSFNVDMRKGMMPEAAKTF